MELLLVFIMLALNYAYNFKIDILWIMIDNELENIVRFILHALKLENKVYTCQQSFQKYIFIL